MPIMYFGGAITRPFNEYLAAERVQNILISYAEVMDKGTNIEEIQSWYKEHGTEVSILLDCGAYSVENTGRVIDINAYIGYIKNNQQHLVGYANLDVINDPQSAEKTARNQQIMEEQGLHPFPTFHLGEDTRLLKEIADKYPFIGLGGTAGKNHSTAADINFWNTCFEILKVLDYKGKVHGWGIASPRFIMRYPWFSVDTIEWMPDTRGRPKVIVPDTPFPRRINPRDKSKVEPYLSQLREIGIDPNLLDTEQERTRLNITMYKLIEQGKFVFKNHKTNFEEIDDSNHQGEGGGPKTTEGKAKSRINALKHGLSANPELLKGLVCGLICPKDRTTCAFYEKGSPCRIMQSVKPLKTVEDIENFVMERLNVKHQRLFWREVMQKMEGFNKEGDINALKQYEDGAVNDAFRILKLKKEK